MSMRMMIAIALVGCATNEAGGDFGADWPSSGARASEGARCVVVELDNSEPIAVAAVRARFTGAEHLTVYRVAADTALAATPQPCEPLAGAEPILVATAAWHELVLPEGIAFAFAAHQRLRLELGAGEAQEASVEIDVAPAGTIAAATVEHVGFAAADVGPNSAVVVDDFIAMPPAYDDARYFGFVGHTGRHGVGVRIAIAGDASTDKIPVYLPAAFDAAAPATSTIAPRGLPDGGRFYVQCAYYNPTAEGLDELCGFWAYTTR
jgi:hypothetical protein